MTAPSQLLRDLQALDVPFGATGRATQALVSGAGNMTAADLLTTTGTLGQTVRLNDGPDRGAILMWAVPDGSATEQWCWWLWPQAAYA